jgi:hypothetical protein
MLDEIFLNIDLSVCWAVPHAILSFDICNTQIDCLYSFGGYAVCCRANYLIHPLDISQSI